MDWQVILALALGVPIILFPAALIWFMNISGLMQVLKDVRAREKRLAQARKVALPARGRLEIDD